MTLRQLWVRIKALPWDAPLWVAVRDAEEQRKQTKASDIDDALALVQPRKEG